MGNDDGEEIMKKRKEIMRKIEERRGIGVVDNKRGQVAIFVIIALLLVGGIIIYFVVRGLIGVGEIPAEFQPIYDAYDSCIADETRAALDLAGSQGGYIYTPDYIPGSEYAPSSNQLNFLGFGVPYWYYVSNNGIQRESVPRKNEIEAEISQYISERVNECNLDKFYAQGFLINMSEPEVRTTISDNSVSVVVTAPFVVSREENFARRSEHDIEIDSKFGKLYSNAIKIYNKEKQDTFLENYSIDVLRTYAPVDGVELGCSGKIWKTRDVTDELKEALEVNINAIRFKADKGKDYFAVEMPMDSSVNLLYSRTWPTKIEITGADDELMVAEPVGTQEGLGTMGFCYAPYHFVYDIYYPVLVQVYEGNEIFQFSTIVVIDKNRPREGIYSEIPVEEPDVDICRYMTQDIDVGVYDIELNRIDANISYSCLNQICRLGETIDGRFVGKAPACVNGILRVNTVGYTEKKQLFSTNEEIGIDVIMDREYNVEIELESGGDKVRDMAIVTFVSDKTKSAFLPEMNEIKLNEGFYNVSIYVYGNSSLVLPAYTKRQCSEVPKGVFGGFFGVTEEKCYDIAIPETKIENALVGGGKSNDIYLLPGDLEDGKLKLEVGALPTPKTLEELQSNYQLFEVLNVGVIG